MRREPWSYRCIASCNGGRGTCLLGRSARVLGRRLFCICSLRLGCARTTTECFNQTVLAFLTDGDEVQIEVGNSIHSDLRFFKVHTVQTNSRKAKSWVLRHEWVLFTSRKSLFVFWSIRIAASKAKKLLELPDQAVLRSEYLQNVAFFPAWFWHLLQH